jgi:hypothetical protein
MICGYRFPAYAIVPVPVMRCTAYEDLAQYCNGLAYSPTDQRHHHSWSPHPIPPFPFFYIDSVASSVVS